MRKFLARNAVSLNDDVERTCRCTVWAPDADGAAIRITYRQKGELDALLEAPAAFGKSQRLSEHLAARAASFAACQTIHRFAARIVCGSYLRSSGRWGAKEFFLACRLWQQESRHTANDDSGS